MCGPLDLGEFNGWQVHFTYGMNVHQQSRLCTFHDFREGFLWRLHTNIVSLRDHRLAVDLSWSFDNPVAGFFLLEPAFVADPFVHFAPFIFPGSDPEHSIAAVP